MKHIFVAFVALCFVATTFGSAYAYSEKDLMYASYLAQKGIIVDNASKPSDYRFDDNITRAELVGMSLLIQGAEIPTDYRCKQYFEDVTSALSTWICRAVELAADEGLITKLNDLFRPQENITRAEAFSILFAASRIYDDDAVDQVYTLFDHDAVKWQQIVFNKLVQAGLDIPGVDYGDSSEEDIDYGATTVREIMFPIRGSYSAFGDNFGDGRSGGRTHIGIDIMAPQMTPLVAVVDGTITFAPTTEPYWGYAIYLKDNDGYVYKYLHVNNDTPGTDDGKADLEFVYGPGIYKGAKVQQGDVVGYVGDSGNAEWVGNHLHFEMSGPNKEVINPYATLKLAEAQSQPVYFYPNRPATRSEIFDMAVQLMTKESVD